MVHLRDKATGSAVGTITDDQLQFLIDLLEEESEEDTDYYINQATVEMLEERGADPQLVRVLRDALGTREEMDIEWSRT